MKIYELFFSPTGGTKKAADILAHSLADEIVTIDLTDSNTDFHNVSLSEEDVALIAVPSYANFAFMVILVSVFTLLWFKKDTGYNWQSLLIPYGRMSLTNYISQSIMGVTIYYGFGLSMYKYAGATGSLLIALLIFTIQLIFSRWWLARHKQGPLEFLWRKGTWI